MFPEGNPHRLAENEVKTLLGMQSYPRRSVQILVFHPRFFQTQLGIECFPPCPLASLLLEAFFALSCRWRPYRVESTRSLPTPEVKQPRAWSVLWWGTAWEDQGAASFCPNFFPLSQRQIMPPWPVLRLQDNNIECTKNLIHFPIACHPCAGAMLIFSASFQFYRMFPCPPSNT